jgi:hypothetical protein
MIEGSAYNQRCKPTPKINLPPAASMTTIRREETPRIPSDALKL